MERPTFTPSIRTWAGYDEHGRERNLCHSFITGGMISFCLDSHHDLKGKEIELPDWDEA
jgi:hypothetical protein